MKNAMFNKTKYGNHMANHIKWTYEACYQEARKYKSRREFSKGNRVAYHVALKKCWLDEYTWFETKKKPNGYWTEQACYQEAQKYHSRTEFQKSCSRAYKVARINGWLDEYTWFEDKKKPNGYWTYETCAQLAQKCHSRSEFRNNYNCAYKVALKNGWLDSLYEKTEKKPYGYWTYEACYKEAREYTSRKEFSLRCQGGYNVALKNGWLDDYTWFKKDLNPYENKRDNVYCYIFKELNSVYVGRTVDPNKRNKEHNTDVNSSVYKFAKQNNIPIPQITTLETNLSLEEGLEREHFYVTKFKKEGWNLLNKAKTGKNCGSIGNLSHRKWNKKTCEQEASKYTSKKEFRKGNCTAYQVALKNGWLDTWFKEKKQKSKGYWTEQTCWQEAQKYSTRSEFKKNCGGAYEVARKNGWLDTWLGEMKQKPNGYWNYETCYQAAQKCKTKSEFAGGCRGAYKVALKNGWLDKYTWFKKTK